MPLIAFCRLAAAAPLGRWLAPAVVLAGSILVVCAAAQDDGPTGVIDDKFNVLEHRVVADPRPKKIILIAGRKSHAPGEHEYEKGCRLLKHCLDNASNVGHRIKTIVITGGWPTDLAILNDAATILLFSDGADREESNHPLLLNDDRLAHMQKLMDKGVGLVVLHYALFVPTQRGGEQYLDWLGGYFDYDSANDPKDRSKWYSRLGASDTTTTPLAPRHPICLGVEPFKAKTEYYWHIRFRPDDPRRMPLLTFDRSRDDAVVAWALQRKNGGRSFAFTEGHFHSNWQIEPFRRLVLNALLWTSHLDVPPGGVRSALPALEISLPDSPAPR